MPPLLDLESYSLEALLMIAARLGLIERYEISETYVLVVVQEQTLIGKHAEARVALTERIEAWWREGAGVA